jgi:hypothetical protein
MKTAVVGMLVLVLFVSATRARGSDVELEKKSYLPLIAGSVYSYDATFEKKQTRASITVKSLKKGKIEAFYFLEEGQTTNVIIGTGIFAEGICIRQTEGLAVVHCFWEDDVKNVNFEKDAVLILKDAPEKGQSVECHIPPVAQQGHECTMRITVDGTEDVTVPAGTFKDCLKIKVEEICSPGKQGDAITYTGWVWLAKGVGVVKWVRTTGRVELLTAFKLGTPAK